MHGKLAWVLLSHADDLTFCVHLQNHQGRNTRSTQAAAAFQPIGGLPAAALCASAAAIGNWELAA